MTCRRRCCSALAVALVPTVLLILAIGAFFARRASKRFERIHDAIVSIMNGELHSRLPVADEGDDVDKVARAVNLMLDEIERLLDQIKSVGDNIAHDLRTPLMVARAKIDRALEEDAGVESLRAAMRAALAQIDKASVTIAAILRVSAVENGARQNRFKDFDLGAVCAEVVEFYQPLAESKSVEMTHRRRRARPCSRRRGPDARGDLEPRRQRGQIHPGGRQGSRRGPHGRRVAARGGERHRLWRSAAANATKIFRRFFRGERSDAAGHGLGLSIAQTIANLHGFQLTVEDNNPGARFESCAPRRRRVRLGAGTGLIPTFGERDSWKNGPRARGRDDWDNKPGHDARKYFPTCHLQAILQAILASGSVTEFCQAFIKNKSNGMVIITKPMKNIGPTTKRKSGSHDESGTVMSAESAGINRKNIVTKPLSLFVAVNAT